MVRLELGVSLRPGAEAAAAADLRARSDPATWAALVAFAAAVCSEAEAAAAGSLVVVLPAEQALHLRRELALPESAR